MRHSGSYIGVTEGGILSDASGGLVRGNGLSEHEIQIRLETVRVGIWLTVIVSLGTGFYALLTWDQDNRTLILAVTLLGLASLPFLFAALSYPPKETAIIGAFTVISFMLIAFGVGGGLIFSGMGGFALLSIALLSSWEARNQASRRAELAQTAEALQASEATSWVQARPRASTSATRCPRRRYRISCATP